jgi:hypothetical protein
MTQTIKYSTFNFGPFVMKTKLEEYVVEELLEQGLKTKKKYNYNLAGHLDNQFLYPNETQDWFLKKISSVLQCYRDAHCEFHRTKKLNVEIGLNDLWINFMKAGDFNPLHTHYGDYSFVLFLKIPKKLKEEQQKFKGLSGGPGTLNIEYGQVSRPRWSVTGFNIFPEVGDFIIFPSLLQHWVAPFKSKIERISVSGNLSILNKKELPSDYF